VEARRPLSLAVSLKTAGRFKTVVEGRPTAAALQRRASGKRANPFRCHRAGPLRFAQSASGRCCPTAHSHWGGLTPKLGLSTAIRDNVRATSETLAMARTQALTNRVAEQLGVALEDITARFVSARSAPVADVDHGYLRGHRYTDAGPNGFGLYEIVDDQQGSFINVPVNRQLPVEAT
jgi:hypothetical protein